jgi:hypothetical protein
MCVNVQNLRSNLIDIILIKKLLCKESDEKRIKVNLSEILKDKFQ